MFCVKMIGKDSSTISRTHFLNSFISLRDLSSKIEAHCSYKIALVLKKACMEGHKR